MIVRLIRHHRENKILSPGLQQ